VASNKEKELKKFLEEKVSLLKKELEYYEYLLALIESNVDIRRKEEKTEEIQEVKVGQKTIALITQSIDSITLRLLLNSEEKNLSIDELKNKIKTISTNAKIIVEKDDRGLVKTIHIKDLESPVIIEGILELIKQHLGLLAKD